ncbi:hypothetical protein GCM10027019_22780 [Melaminivora jejuensis]|uniref:hypothetical protein n=1 Tax=Melaminivora jejuensis TaxID=1267217 RepID=UPI001AE01ACA|nr:hypothetical protein [Melaminivora jejuensis]UHJ64567.1 hypothetical protein LVC68_14630 [Melaminivora jejuensis]
MDTLTKKKADRFRLLNRLYEITDGHTMKIVSMWDVGDTAQLARNETENVVNYLVGEHLVEHRTIGGGISITHHGIVEVERALSAPESPTHYFPPVVNIVNVHSMVGSQIQQGTHGSTQSQVANTNDIDAIRVLISKFGACIHDLPISAEEKAEAQAELSTVEAQLASSKPKISILRESLKTLRNLVEGVASNAVAAGLLPFFGPLAALLGS